MTNNNEFLHGVRKLLCRTIWYIAPVLLLFMAACQTSEPTARPAPIAAEDIPISEAGVTAVDDVIVSELSNNRYRLIVAGDRSLARDDFLPPLWCRTSRLVEEKGLVDWQAEELQMMVNQDPTTPKVVLAIVKLLDKPAKNPNTRDWCSQVKA